MSRPLPPTSLPPGVPRREERALKAGIFAAILVVVAMAGLTALDEVRLGENPFDLLPATVALSTAYVVLAAGTWRGYRRASEREARARESLLDVEERFKALTESAQDAIVSADGAGAITYFNPAAERIFGYAAGEVLGRPLDLLIPERLHGAHREGMARYLSSGDARVVGRTVELPGRRKDGGEFSAELSLAAWTTNGKAHFSGIIRDTTERKRADEENARLAMAVEHTEDKIVITNRDGLIEYVNPAFERFTGYALKEALGKTPAIIKSGTHDDAFYRELWQTILSGRTFAGEFVNRKKNGELFHEEKTISPLRGPDGAITHFVSVGRDVTERKRAEEERARLEDQLRQSQKMEAVGMLAGGVAHELNNPLQAITAYAAVLQKKARALGEAIGGPEANQCLGMLASIQQASERSAKIVQNLLAFARKDAEAKTTVDLNQVVRSTVEFLGHSLYLKNVRVETDLEGALPAILGNPVSLQQVFTNLLLNARDAMPNGGTVALRTRRENGSVEVAVTDTGTGMAPDIQAHLFEPFFTTKAPGKGTGLGLSMVYGIVKEHGGSIEVRSDAGKGTTFTLRLPLPSGTPFAAPAQMAAGPLPGAAP